MRTDLKQMAVLAVIASMPSVARCQDLPPTMREVIDTAAGLQAFPVICGKPVDPKVFVAYQTWAADMGYDLMDIHVQLDIADRRRFYETYHNTLTLKCYTLTSIIEKLSKQVK